MYFDFLTRSMLCTSSTRQDKRGLFQNVRINLTLDWSDVHMLKRKYICDVTGPSCLQNYVGCPCVICEPLSTPLYSLQSDLLCCTCQSNRWFCRAGVISWMICGGCDGAGVSWKQRTFLPAAETGQIRDALPRIVPFCVTTAPSVRKSQPL